tara:strand:- start:1361 stop:2059 length:699 start_codon:yes stop_codon:yes gene_type:complete
MSKQGKPRRRSKNYYFRKVHEEAIVKYAISNSTEEKDELYRQYIGPVFNEMVDKIVYTYKFTTLPNIDCLKDECKVWLTTILDKYDPNKGSKAFSYFSVITKNWFIHKVKKHSQALRRERSIDDIIHAAEHKELIVENVYLQNRESNDFWELFFTEMESWNTGSLKANEEKVLHAIRTLFDSSEDIEIFNKKAIYLYLREITGLNTKQVVSNLNKMRIRYRSFRQKWDNGMM